MKTSPLKSTSVRRARRRMNAHTCVESPPATVNSDTSISLLEGGSCTVPPAKDLTTVDQLVPDCLEHVFSFLPKRDKGHVAQVCRLWKDVCYRRSLWKDEVATLRLTDKLRTNKNILHTVRSRGITKIHVKEHKGSLNLVTKYLSASLKTLNLSGCQYTTDESLRKAFSRVNGVMTNFEVLNLNYCTQVTENGLCSILKKTKSLKQLSLNGCIGMGFVNGRTKLCLQACEKLEVLSLAGCKDISWEDLSTFFNSSGAKHLKYINLQDCDWVCDCSLNILGLSPTNHLEYLNLSYCISITDNGLKSIARGMPSLKYILLQSTDNISAEGVVEVVKNCTKLRGLDLAHCYWVNDTALTEICEARTPSSLEEIDISCAKITDRAMMVVAERLHELRHLRIGQCNRLTDLSLTHIGTHLSSLETVDLYGCAFSGEAVNSLWDSLPNLAKVNLSMISS